MISSLGMQLLIHFEGCELEAYQDGGGVWTIGIGTTKYSDGTPVKQYDRLKDYKEALKLVREYMTNVEFTVGKAVNVPLEPCEFDALCVFAYNIGSPEFLDSTLLKKVNAKASSKEIETQFMRWVHDNGKIVPGLVARRKAESFLFTTGIVKIDY